MSRADVLVDADWVQAHLADPGVVLVEVHEDTTAYDKGHIQGAVKLDWKRDLAGSTGVRNELGEFF
jgi:thiosulfate/3-mercaptopyruvate sulfurtransferase